MHFVYYCIKLEVGIVHRLKARLYRDLVRCLRKQRQFLSFTLRKARNEASRVRQLPVHHRQAWRGLATEVQSTLVCLRSLIIHVCQDTTPEAGHQAPPRRVDRQPAAAPVVQLQQTAIPPCPPAAPLTQEDLRRYNQRGPAAVTTWRDSTHPRKARYASNLASPVPAPEVIPVTASPSYEAKYIPEVIPVAASPSYEAEYIRACGTDIPCQCSCECSRCATPLLADYGLNTPPCTPGVSHAEYVVWQQLRNDVIDCDDSDIKVLFPVSVKTEEDA